MNSPVKRPTGPFKMKPFTERELMAMEKKPKPKPTTLRGKAAVDAYKKSLTPAEIAKVEALAKKALEEKYPGMFIPGTRTSAGIYRSK